MTCPPADASPSTDLLQDAARRVVRRMRDEALVSPDEELLRGEVEMLVGAVRAVLGGGAAPALPPPRGDRLGLLRALRSELVGAWPEDQPLLPTMRAFEQVQEVLLGGAGTGSHPVDPHARSLVREVAHMLRSPLGSIVMLADTMKVLGDGLTVEVRDKQLGIIHRAALTVATLAGDLLTLLGEEDVVGDPAELDLPPLLESVADVVRPVAEAHASQLEVQVPDAGRRVGPPTVLVRALLGMTLAAARHTTDGVVRISAAVGGDDDVHFEVTGRGADAVPDRGLQEIRRIFRVDPDGSAYTLSPEGMGLVASERLVRHLGSELVVETPGPGALRLAFTLALPRSLSE